jgi:hypothetical protein
MELDGIPRTKYYGKTGGRPWRPWDIEGFLIGEYPPAGPGTGCGRMGLRLDLQWPVLR